MTHLLTLLIIAAVALIAPPVDAANVDAVENILGTTNIHAITGHGRLSLGLSASGDLTVASWPSPSATDQLGYITSNALDARETPRMGAAEGAGLFLGLVVEEEDGLKTYWLRDESTWSTGQTYGPTDGPNVHTTHRSERLGLSVEVIAAVDPNRNDAPGDVAVLHATVTRDEGSPVQNAWLMTYANLSPVPFNMRIPELPFADWGLDGRNDFAALWDEAEGMVLHLHPGNQGIVDEVLEIVVRPPSWTGPLGEAIEVGQPDPAALQQLADGLDDTFVEGVVVALTSTPAPDQHHVGQDETPFCANVDDLIDNFQALEALYPGLPLPVDAEVADLLRCGANDGLSAPWPEAAEDAYGAAGTGSLPGQGLAVGEVNEAIRTPVTFDEAGVGVVSVVLGFGEDAATARQVAAAARQDPAAILAAAEDDLVAWLSDKRVPTVGSERVQRVARRALINVRVGTDRPTGAVVASISRQPPYGLDWPRDGAFFNVMLDASGQRELVSRRATLYAEWQRKEPIPPEPLIDVEPPVDPDTGSTDTYPAFAWEMNYYTDGLPGGVFRFEIDNTAFSLWAIVAHVGWLDEEAPADYLRRHWPAIKGAADLLTRWRDAETGLHAPAQEDDNDDYTQTLHGSVTTFGAIDIAARAARLLGEDEDAARWETRAEELRGAILTHQFDTTTGLFISEAASEVNPGSKSSGPTAWALWPCHLLPPEDTRMMAQMQADLDAVTPIINLEEGGGAYMMKNTVSLGIVAKEDPVIKEALAGLIETLASQATATDHFGEVVVEVDGVADQRVANPHLWEGTLFYLSALALEDPDALMAYDAVLPPSGLSDITQRPAGEADVTDAPESADSASNGKKGCGAASGSGVAWWALGWLAWWRTRRADVR